MQGAYEDVWSSPDIEPPFPEKRMKHLLLITGATFARAVQTRLAAVALWQDPFPLVSADHPFTLILNTHTGARRAAFGPSCLLEVGILPGCMHVADLVE